LLDTSMLKSKRLEIPKRTRRAGSRLPDPS
jgi:hypothetical protein